MAIYHLSVKVITRSQGRSAVAAAAYRAADKIENEYDGIAYDYRKKNWVVHSEIILPTNAPSKYRDRSTLWNAVEAAEKSKTAQLAREVEIALPRELNLQQQVELVRMFVNAKFVTEGMCVDFSIHNPPLRDDRGHPVDNEGNIVKNESDYIFMNPHVHIMLTMRPMDEQGKWKPKSATEYICIRDGTEVEMTGAEYKERKSEGWQKQYKFQDGNKIVWMTDEEGQGKGLKRVSRTPKQSKFGRQDLTVQFWNSKDRIYEWREGWELYCNTYFSEHGINTYIDSRSYEKQGREELPTVHLGVSANCIEKRADRLERQDISVTRTEAGAINAEIKRYNSLIRKIREITKTIVDTAHEKIIALRCSLIGVEYHLSALKKELSEKAKERYHKLSDYLKTYDLYQKKIDDLKISESILDNEINGLRIIDKRKKKELLQKKSDVQGKLEFAYDLQSGLAVQYNLERDIAVIRKEFRQLEYVSRAEELEKKDHNKKDQILREYRKECKSGYFESQESLNEGLDRIEKALQEEYGMKYDSNMLAQAIEKTNIELKKIAEEENSIKRGRKLVL